VTQRNINIPLEESFDVLPCEGNLLERKEPNGSKLFSEVKILNTQEALLDRVFIRINMLHLPYGTS
jgi:hypothetical protein